MTSTCRIRLITDRYVTCHLSPSPIARWLGAVERDFEAHRVSDLGGHIWVTYDNRPVSQLVAREIEAELTRACVGDRLKELTCKS